jgi:hypothetical protein
MPRVHHSASSLALGSQCERAFAYRYIAGIRDPDVPWEAIVRAGKDWIKIATPRQRSASLGKAMHAIGESWYGGGSPDWSSFPGQVYLSGAHLLPHPARCHEIEIELPIGFDPYPQEKEDDPDGCMMRDGIRFVGFVDLRVRPWESELDRLGLRAAAEPFDGWITIDYKSTKDPKWIKTPAMLRADEQANLYAYDGITKAIEPGQIFEREYATPYPMRWVYFRTQGKREARAVDFGLTFREADHKVHLLVQQAKALDTLETVDQALKNPDACNAYGGCPFHHSKGGPCDAKRNLGTAILAWQRSRNPKPFGDENMIDFKAKFGKLQTQAGQVAQAVAPPSVAAPAPPAPPPAPAPEPAAPEAPAAAPVVRKPRGARAAAPAVAPAPAPAPEPEAATGSVEVATGAEGVTCELTFKGPPDQLRDLLSLLLAE